MDSNGFKNTLHILIILIFNNFLAQSAKDSLKKNPLPQKDKVVKDTIIKKEQIDDIVHYKADNIRNDIPKKMSYLKKKAQVKYQDMQIDADYMRIDWDKGEIFAIGETDKKGKIIKPAVATQGGKKYDYDQLKYNYKTKVAIAYNARTEESEGVIVAQKTKKYNDSVFALKRGRYTTDEYFLKKKDTVADYYLLAPDMKMIKGKEPARLITGPIQMYIEEVPTPFVLPFAILPITQKRSAGLLIPSFGERQDVGFFLNNLGYYQPIGEHFDLKLYTDLYTKGSWNVRPELTYRKKYRYSGNFTAEFGTTIRGIAGLSDYSKSGTYSIRWTHQQDTKANPFLNFSASVSIVSNKFYNNTINNNYLFNQSALNTQQNSTISVTKRFLNLPVTLSGSASYSQNFATGLADVRLPQLTANVNQFYLLKPKTGVRTGLLENIAVNTNFSFTNYVTAQQNELFTSAMYKKMQTGLKNDIALSTNSTIMKYFTLSLSSNINNVLVNKTLSRIYDPITSKNVDTYNQQISGFSTFNTSASIQTILYGMLKFSKNSKIQAIRHMVTPSIGFTYSPDFGKPSWGYYSYYYDSKGNYIPYSKFEGGIFGTPSTGLVQALTFSLNNNLEMKVKSKQDSTGVKKIKIFESLNMSGGYNFAATTHKFSPITISTQSSFFKNKLNVNMGMTLNPYQIIYDPLTNVGTLTENFGHFSVANFNATMSLPLSNEFLFGKEEDLSKKYKTKGEIRNESYYFDENNYSRFHQPWTLNLNAQYNYSQSLSSPSGTKTASLGFNGSIKLTPYWTITGSTYLDMVTGKLGYGNLGFARDQRSFIINFNWIPFGQYKTYDFYIGIKANILKDAVRYKDRSFQQSGSSF